MNRYQREKAKRRKKLSSLGIPYYNQKKFIKAFGNDLVKIDEAIVKVEELRKKPWLSKIQKLLNFIRGGASNEM